MTYVVHLDTHSYYIKHILAVANVLLIQKKRLFREYAISDSFSVYRARCENTMFWFCFIMSPLVF